MEKNWAEIRKLAGEYAADNLENSGMNCAESVYEALIRSGALDAPIDTVAYVTGFGGGGGGVGLTCGALSSAILANNMVHGRAKPADAADRTELREKYYQRYNNIVSDFMKESGGGLCREIINQFKEGYRDEDSRPNCIRLCGVAAQIAVDYLQKDMEEAEKLQYDFSVVGIKNWA